MNKAEMDSANQKTLAQYSFWQILGIWALATVPMGLLAWVVFPAFASKVRMEPGIFLWILMIVGLMWQVLLSLVILYREHGSLRPYHFGHSAGRHRAVHHPGHLSNGLDDEVRMNNLRRPL